MDDALIRSFLKQTVIVRAPVRRLATFGATAIPYHVISPIDGMKDKTRVREGTVTSQRPKILTAEALSERFEGFGTEGREFSKWLSSEYRDLLRALEYNFNNKGRVVRTIAEGALSVAERIQDDMEKREVKDQAVIRCPDGAWSLALMKFTLDQAESSFPTNVRDLDRRGLFDPAGKQASLRRREIERLFSSAKPGGRDVLKTLGAKLHEYGLFAEYEDRYLSFF